MVGPMQKIKGLKESFVLTKCIGYAKDCVKIKQHAYTRMES